MPIFKYTTEIESSKTVAEIQHILAKAGAQHVGVEYDGQGQPVGVAFTVRTPYGLRSFVLPGDEENVYKVLVRDRVPGKYQTRAQASRVAWRIRKEWLSATLAIIASELVSLDQLMLPYMQTGDGGTVYERFAAQQLQIEAGGGDDRP